MKIASFLCCAASLLIFAGCASVSVRDESRGGVQPVRKPEKIYVEEFETKGGEFKIAGDEAKDPEAFKKKTASMLNAYIVRTVSAHVAPAIASPGRPGASGWLVKGQFIKVHTGSRVLRAGVGLGAGGTKMETRVEVYDLSRHSDKPFMTFQTTGGSNAMPGLLTSTGPVSAAFSMTTQAMMGVSDDSARTSRMITGELSEYMVSRGWIPKNKIYESKKAGGYQLVHEQWTEML